MFVNVVGECTYEEEQAYIKRAHDKYGKDLEGLDIRIDGDEAELTYYTTKGPFERIRRITGYLTGTLDRWNNAKQAEERDRVKHEI